MIFNMESEIGFLRSFDGRENPGPHLQVLVDDLCVLQR